MAQDPARIRLSRVIGGLSYALDLTEGEPPGHAVRSCLIGMRIAHELGLDAATRSNLFYALLMKDAGCSANSAKMAALFDADDHEAKRTAKRSDWSRKLPAFVWSLRVVAPEGSRRARAARLRAIKDEGQVTRSLMRRAAIAAPSSRSSSALSRRPRRRSAPSTSTGTATASPTVCAARRSRCSAASPASRRPPRSSTAKVGRLRRARSPRAGAPAGSTPGSSTRSALVPRRRRVLGVARPGRRSAWEPEERLLTADDVLLDRIAIAFAGVIDVKSPWTYRHSDLVAVLATRVATELGADDADVAHLRRAAMLHDIGKLAISNRILDKPGRLTAAECARSASTRSSLRASWSASTASPTSRRWPRRITSGSTAAATPTDCAPTN